MSINSVTKPVLWNFYLSSASWRVRIALNLKNIDYEYKSINLLKNGGEQNSQEFAKINAKQEVPVLFIDNNRLVQSLPIIEYIDETRKNGIDILPRDPVQRAKTRQIAEIINSGIQPYQNLNVLKRLVGYSGEEKKIEWVQFYLTKGCQALEASLSETAGKYCVGDSVSLADLSLAPQCNAFERYKIDMSSFPKIVEINRRLNELEAFKKAHGYRQIDTPADLKLD